LPQSEELYNVLRATAFKGDVTDAQLSALMIVASQYGLNPWTKEIYAFPDKGGIVPVVGVDGWSRIINSNPQFDGMDFEQDADSCTCIIYRKDRAHPIKVTEWMAECKRNGVGPWQSHPYRMLRHKAMIQCARIAFGFGGIYDVDEAERIVEAEAKIIHTPTGSPLVEIDRMSIIADVADSIKSHFDSDDLYGAYEDYSCIVDEEEKIALWKLLPSNIRSALKKYGKNIASEPTTTIIEAEMVEVKAAA
jgi:phage recombination protein Bet